jgi:hypothetical protein
MKKFTCCALVVVCLVLLCYVGSASAAAAPGPNVNVVNTPTVNVGNTPNVRITNSPSVSVTNTPTIKNAEDPARATYYYSITPTCPYANVCEATFPAVPAGKRLRLANVRVMFRMTNVAAALSVNLNHINNLLVSFPLTPFNGFYYGSLLSTSQNVDLIFEAGESPVLELGVSAVDTISPDGNLLGVTGYLVDIP